MCLFSKVYSRRQVQTTHWGQTFYNSRKALSLCPGARADKPLGQNFDVNRKLLPLRPCVASLKKSLWIPILYTFFSCFSTCIYSQGQGHTTLCGQNSDVNRKALSLCPFVASFKKYLWSLILYIFLPVLYMYIDQGQVQTTPWGQNFDFNTNLCHSGHLL